MNEHTQTLTLTGEVRCYRIARIRRSRGGVTIGTLLADAIAPLPPYENWCLHVLDGESSHHDDDGRTYRVYRLKSGNRPACWTEAMEGQQVTVKASVLPWSNGLGGYLSRVRLVDESVEADRAHRRVQAESAVARRRQRAQIEADR